VTLYDGYDKQLNRVELGKGETAWLDYGLNAKTEYWIKVHRYNDTRTGNYQLAVNEEICDAGMNQANAFYVDLGDNYTKELDVYDINDWYRFVTTDNYATYQFALTNNSINTTVYLTVFDEYDTELGQIEVDKGQSKILDLNLKENREYTVKISRYSGGRVGYYQISVSEMICDSGLTRAEAVPLNLNQTFYGKADTGFSEWYCFTFTKDGTYTLKLTNNSINTTLYATVYDALGTELGSVSADQTETRERSLTITAGTVLYVKISRYTSSRFGNYTILVS
jgi:hypothetical protein